MNKKLTKTLAITILSSMVMVGCGAVEKPVDVNSTTPVQEQQVDTQTKTNKKPVVQDDEGKQPTAQVNKPTQNKTTHKTVETVKPNTTQKNKTTKTQTTKKSQTTKNKVDMTPNNPNVMPDNSAEPTPIDGWSTDGNYYNGERVTEEEKEYMKQYGHLPRFDDGEWNYNPYTGETREY
jgi:hypothetical protein